MTQNSWGLEQKDPKSEGSRPNRPVSQVVGIAAGILFLLFLIAATVAKLVAEGTRAWQLFEAGSYVAAGITVVITLMVVGGVISFFRK